jgi:hypothetical protein
MNTLFLLRQVDDWGEGCMGAWCLGSYSSTTFCVLLLVLLTSVACLVYKLVRLLTIPELWHERNRLRAVKTELEMRARRLEMLVPGPEGGDNGSGSDSDCRGEAEAASQVPGGSTLHSGPSPLREDTIVVAAISHGALEIDGTWPTRKAVVVTTFEIAVLPECGR